MLDAQRQDYSCAQVDQHMQLDHEQMFDFASKLQQFAASDADEYKVSDHTCALLGTLASVRALHVRSVAVQADEYGESAHVACEHRSIAADVQLRADKLRQALLEERQKRHALEKEAKRLRAECHKLREHKDSTPLRAAAARPRWRFPFPRSNGLQAINEDADEASLSDEVGSVHSSIPDQKDSPETSTRSTNIGAFVPREWDDGDMRQFRLWSIFAGLICVLVVLILVLLLAVPLHPPLPSFTLEPQLNSTSTTGTSFSVNMRISMASSVHYIAVPAGTLGQSKDVDANAVVAATLQRSSNGYSQVHKSFSRVPVACLELTL